MFTVTLISSVLALLAAMSSALQQGCASRAASVEAAHVIQTDRDIPQPDPQNREPEQQQPQQHAAGENAAAPKVEQVLDDLEASSRDLNAFTATVTYEKLDDLLGRKETRTGEIIYRKEGDGSKSFAILFDSQIVNDRRARNLKHYIFDGRWLAEIDHQNKQFIKREIVQPGKQLDPLKLGEGPIPLPIGQAKADVLARFEVGLAAVPESGLLRTLENVDGLKLTPKPGTSEAREFKRVELFYDRATRLPAGIITHEANGDTKTILLRNIQRNPELDDATRKKLDIADPNPREWQISIQPWGG